MLRIQLLGDFRLTDGEAVIATLAQTRQQALLAYLLLHYAAPQARQHLAFLLWPDSSERQAQTNLRKALVHLRRVAPLFGQALYADHKVVQWRLTAPFVLDVAEFAEKLALATAAENAGQPEQAITLLTAAVDLYRGPLLPSCYDDWIITERERLQQLCLNALTRLTLLHEAQHDFAVAIRTAQQLLHLDPLHEPTYTQLMRLYTVQGDHASALRIYHTCATVLERELGVEPGYATQATYTRLLSHEEPTVPRLSTASRAQKRLASHLVGRQAEWAQLQATWRIATGQRAHLVCLVGEAGIGKTHLAEELLHWANQQGFATAQARAYAGEGRLAYASVVEWLRADAMRAARKELATVWLSELARLLPEILIEQPAVTPPPPMTEAWQRQRLFEGLARALVAALQPLLLLIDDLQWCDSETLEWLRYLMHFAARARILLVATVRSEEIDDAHPLQAFYRHLRSAEQLTEIALGPLDADQTAILATQVAQRPLDAQWLAKLYPTTEGNPLFVVETVRSALSEQVGEMGSRGADNAPTPLPSFTPTPLPPKVQAVIQHRLAQLSPGARELAALAAVIGRSLSAPVLAQASALIEDELVRGLDELWQRHLVREQGINTYDFSHDRIREVAYATISPARRRLLHRQVAQALERLSSDHLDSVSGQLAVHYEQAGLPQQAFTYYRRAATVAHLLFAYPEMVTYLKKSLALLESLPATAEHVEQKLDVLSLLGNILIIVKGFTAPEVEEVLSKARELCQSVDSLEQRFAVLRGLYIYWQQRCRWKIAAELNQETLELARKTQNLLHRQAVLRSTGALAFHQGKLPEALAYFEQAIALYRSDQHDSATNYRQDEGLANLHRISGTLWLLGYPDQAQIRMREMLALARKVARPFDLLLTLDFAFDVERYLRKPQAAQVLVEEMNALATKHPYPHYVATDMIYRGWLLAEQGEFAKGIVLLQQGLDALHKLGTLLFMPQRFSILVEVYGQSQQFVQGLTLVTQTLALVAETGDEFWSAELHRLKGELLLGQGGATHEVEACFQEAIAIARRQAAKSLELRAVISLARLWQQQGRGAEAQQQLAEIYAWFTEGFATVDLQEARLLLEQLERV